MKDNMLLTVAVVDADADGKPNPMLLPRKEDLVASRSRVLVAFIE